MSETDLENTIQLTIGLDYADLGAEPAATGVVTFALAAEQAPKHAERIKLLAREGYYDGKLFHRVIDGFMAQTGSPRGDGVGGADMPDLPAEFSDLPFERGVVGMARTANPNSANAQFFIMFAPAPHLDRQYTVVGRVLEGMDVVDRIKRTEGVSVAPDRILSAKVCADLPS